MNVSLDWDNDEQTIIRLTLHDGWAYDELFELNPRTIAMMRSVDHPVHVLVDYTLTNDMPLGSAMHAKNLSKDWPANFGILAAVTTNLLVQRTLMLVQGADRGKRGIGSRVFFVPTFEEAYDKFAQYQAETM